MGATLSHAVPDHRPGRRSNADNIPFGPFCPQNLSQHCEETDLRQIPNTNQALADIVGLITTGHSELLSNAEHGQCVVCHGQLHLPVALRCGHGHACFGCINQLSVYQRQRGVNSSHVTHSACCFCSCGPATAGGGDSGQSFFVDLRMAQILAATTEEELRAACICELCCNAISEPVTLSCGHSACRSCLESLQARFVATPDRWQKPSEVFEPRMAQVNDGNDGHELNRQRRLKLRTLSKRPELPKRDILCDMSDAAAERVRHHAPSPGTQRPKTSRGRLSTTVVGSCQIFDASSGDDCEAAFVVTRKLVSMHGNLGASFRTRRARCQPEAAPALMARYLHTDSCSSRCAMTADKDGAAVPIHVANTAGPAGPAAAAAAAAASPPDRYMLCRRLT